MKSVTKRELNQNTAQVLSIVAEGEDVVVTQRDQSRWRITSHTPEESALHRWERDGLYTAPSPHPVPWEEAPTGRAYSSSEVDELLEEVRGER